MKFEFTDELSEALRAGPWLWPRDDQDNVLCRAREISGLAGPPVALGFPLVSVNTNEDKASLWVAVEAPRDDPRREISPFRGRAIDSWRAASAALPRSLPVLWGPVGVEFSKGIAARHLETLALKSRLFRNEDQVLEGPSFGLGFIIALAARVLSLKLPADAIASAQIDAFGRLGPVGSLGAKIKFVVGIAPRIRRFFVAAEQEEEAERAAPSWLEIVPVRTAGHALQMLYPDLVERMLTRAQTDEGRGEITASLFRLALGDRVSPLDWRPVYEAAARLAARIEIEVSIPYELQFARAVCARHCAQYEPLDPPPEGWLDALPRPRAVAVVAHLVQHRADTGTPGQDAIDRLVEEYLPARPRDRFAQHLKLCGALGRLWAVSGRLDEAIGLHREVVLGWRDLERFDGISYSLCEWFRLAGVLDHRTQYGEALAVMGDVRVAQALSALDRAHLDVARARAVLDLNPPPEARYEALDRLRDIGRSGHVPRHLRSRAHRLLIQNGEASSGLLLDDLVDGDSAVARHVAILALYYLSEGQDPSELCSAIDAIVDRALIGARTEWLEEHTPEAISTRPLILALVLGGTPVERLVETLVQDSAAHDTAHIAGEVARLYPY